MANTNSVFGGDLLLDDNNEVLDEVINDVKQMKIDTAKMKEYISLFNSLTGIAED